MDSLDLSFINKTGIQPNCILTGFKKNTAESHLHAKSYYNCNCSDCGDHDCDCDCYDCNWDCNCDCDDCNCDCDDCNWDCNCDCDDCNCDDCNCSDCGDPCGLLPGAFGTYGDYENWLDDLDD